MGLPPEVCGNIMANFAPPLGTRNASRLFMAFARRSLEKGRIVQPQAADPVQRFIAEWGIDASAAGLLLSLDPRQQSYVLSEFRPQPGTLNASAKLQSFVKSLMR